MFNTDLGEFDVQRRFQEIQYSTSIFEKSMFQISSENTNSQHKF